MNRARGISKKRHSVPEGQLINDVTRAVDNKRMEWAMGDVIHNRPPPSRWHSDYKEASAAFMDD